ncbi:hypothetical protein OEZ86_006364 [Tetradesmus obliquus]|nr:hypothetical protein OEZ86_006364 [Tetradesmus obliquus]
MSDVEEDVNPIDALIVKPAKERAEKKRRAAAATEADQRNFEVQKLLRAPRYFDDVYEPKGVACWRCGKRGHLAKDCSLSAAKPCYYCAQYGHEPFSCPHRLCFRCGEPGHMTKDCSLQRGQVKDGGRGLCLRCGRAECAAADYSDWFRFEGGCSHDYFVADLDQVRCLHP